MELAQSIQHSIDIVRKLGELAKKVKEAEFKMLLADLTNDLGDAKLEAANLKSELAKLKEQNAALRERIEQRDTAKPTIADSVYQFGGDDGHYCTSCFDVQQRKVRVKLLTGAFTAFGKWECPSCKATFG